MSSNPSKMDNTGINQTSAPCTVSRPVRRKSDRKSQSQRVRSSASSTSVQKQLSLQDSNQTNLDTLLRKDKNGLFTQLAPRLFALGRCQTTKEKRKKYGDWPLGRSSSVSVALVRSGSAISSRQPLDNMSTRGQNVSVLHLRGPPEPWELAAAKFKDMGGSLRSARGTPPGQRELSPVRWGESDAGVYLGRAGWVQVHQRSLDEHRRSVITHKTVLTTLPPRVRLSECHSASEPGRRRPDSLLILRGQPPLEPIPTPTPLLPAYDISSPPPITPIISPPPAFQDLEPHRPKPPHLLRSTAIDDCDSPPLSPASRYRRVTPSPQSPKHAIKPRVSPSCSSVVSSRRSRNVSQSSSEDEVFGKKVPPRTRRMEHRARSSDSTSSSGCEPNGNWNDTWGGRVRRSRSLQLPEERSPALHRPRRHLSKKTMSEEVRGQSGLRLDAEAEARVVAEFMSRTRSRAAARDLLLSRYLHRPEAGSERPVKSQNYSVCVVGGRNAIRDLRGSPCNPSTCDFWPHCTHGTYAPGTADAKPRSKFENVDIDGYVSVRRTNNGGSRDESPRSRSPRTQRTPPGSSPQDPTIRSTRSPDRESRRTSPATLADPRRLLPGDPRVACNGRSPPSVERPPRGNTPDSTNGRSPPGLSSKGTWDPQLRSLSLPKSFLSHRTGHRDSKPGRRFPEDNSLQVQQMSRTAPVTPVRELNIAEATDSLAQQSYPHSTSAPVLDRAAEEEAEIASNEITSNIPVYSSSDCLRSEKSGQESMVEKLRKSISVLRFQKKGQITINSSTDELRDKGFEENVSPEIRRQGSVYGSTQGSVLGSERSSPSEMPSDAPSDTKFRLGPLLWRSSKERKKGKLLGRGAKCKSADSGIQIERGGMAGESSDSRDTDQHEEPDSPIGKSGRGVQRANSELGGQRLLGWEARRPRFRRKPSPSSSLKNGNRDVVPPRSLRRSTSQPLGLDELSPLRKTRTSSEDERGTSEDEALFGSESSLLSLNSGRAPELSEDAAIAEALWDHVAIDPRELAFRAGDLVQVHNTTDKDWWWGSADNRCGWFPSSFVRLRVSQEDTVEDCLAAMAAGSRAAAHLRRTSVSLLSNDQVRSCVVRELLSTEQDFVRGLRDVVEGYVVECGLRKDMFTPAQIQAIFSNIEDLLAFQSRFLEELEARIDVEAPHRSCVGDVFLRLQGGFRMYSEYCNSHPTAIATLQQLYQQPIYSAFFEGCRIMRGLMEIPLDGYLLTPVQRICKYPLQLAELLKYTRPEHEDYVQVKEALSVMRGVAVLVNERKRRMESLEKLASWQARVETWEGEDLLEKSSQLLHQDEVIRVTSGMWTSQISLFLFDHQIVYCKKDLLKRHNLVYKGRMCLDTSEVVDVPDGKDPVLGATVRHAIKIHSLLQDKWLLFCCRNSQNKARWLAALAAERRLVLTDRQEGLELPPAARLLARTAAQVRAEKTKYKRDNSFGEPPMGRKVGTWFTWGGRKQQQHVT